MLKSEVKLGTLISAFLPEMLDYQNRFICAEYKKAARDKCVNMSPAPLCTFHYSRVDPNQFCVKNKISFVNFVS